MRERDTTKKIMPFGRWPSVFTADAIAANNPRLAEPCIVGDYLYWLQNIPTEKGRTTVMRQHLHAENPTPESLLPRPLSAKSKVHEYGGGSYWVDDDQLLFVLGDDQQVYSAKLDKGQHFTPDCLSHKGPETARYADIVWDPITEQVIAVSEDHQEQRPEPETRLVCIQQDGTVATIARGHDFYANPTLSPCGRKLVWLCWNHPNMPWDATEIWLTERDAQGRFQPELARKLVGNANESLFLPRFHPNGDLYFVSDKSNWWNLYKIASQSLHDPQPTATEIYRSDAEFATPQWVFRMSTYHFLDANRLLACCSRDGTWLLLEIDLAQSPASATPIDSRLSRFSDIFADQQGNGVCIAASAMHEPQLYRVREYQLHSCQTASSEYSIEDISSPEAVEFPTSHGDHAYAFFYPPKNAKYQCDAEKPPLIVICHGGPTGATDTSFNPKIQYWTNRGFAVMDVNYRGSTGYGRQYRESLNYNWGIFDVADVCAAANYVVAKGWADPQKLIIKGSSAGGYTVLAALAFTNTFKAGVSLYGIGDLETLVRDTHKFEARYLDTLVGEYPQQQDIYRQRSPIHRVDNIECPLLVFQGLQDKVVPPNQAQAMVDAVSAKGLLVDYVTFEDEGHGFRNGVNIATMLKREHEFYQKVFNL